MMASEKEMKNESIQWKEGKKKKKKTDFFVNRRWQVGQTA